MQKLIAEIDEQAKVCPMSDRKFYIYCKTLAIQKLLMEKEQIIDACNQTEFEEEDNFGIAENLTKGEQYYKETYRGDTIQNNKDKMYSAEEVHNLLDTLLEGDMCSVAGDELIEQFKHKITNNLPI